MPQMGESVTEGTILEWHVSEGQEVAEGDTVVEVSTDKIDAEVPAPASGVVIGEDYPGPIVDHKVARTEALDRYRV